MVRVKAASFPRLGALESQWQSDIAAAAGTLNSPGSFQTLQFIHFVDNLQSRFLG